MTLIRAATPSDTAAALQLLLQLGYNTDAHQFLAALASDHTHVLVAQPSSEDSTLIGLLAFSQTPSLLTHATRILIDALVVDANYRRHKVGTTLLNALESAITTSTTIELTTSIARQPLGTHDFYNALGFHVRSKLFFQKHVTPPRPSSPHTLNSQTSTNARVDSV